jgi:hypothetical protein
MRLMRRRKTEVCSSRRHGVLPNRSAGRPGPQQVRLQSKPCEKLQHFAAIVAAAGRDVPRSGVGQHARQEALIWTGDIRPEN